MDGHDSAYQPRLGGEESHSTTSDGTAGGGPFKDPWELNRAGDDLFYRGQWQLALKKFRAGLKAAGKARTLGAKGVAYPTAVLSRNVALLSALHGDWKAYDDAIGRSALEGTQVTDRDIRDLLDVDLNHTRSYALRARGRFAEAEAVLMAIDRRPDLANNVYRDLRIGVERSNVERNLGNFDQAEQFLKEALGKLEVDGDDSWAPEFLPSQRALVRHYLAVTCIDAMIIDGPANPALYSRALRNHQASETDACSAVQGAPHGPLMQRIRKTSGWLASYDSRHDEALVIADQVRAESHSMGDRKTHCMASLLRFRALAQAGSLDAAAQQVSDAYDVADGYGYWRGKLLAAFMGAEFALDQQWPVESERWMDELVKLDDHERTTGTVQHCIQRAARPRTPTSSRAGKPTK